MTNARTRARRRARHPGPQPVTHSAVWLATEPAAIGIGLGAMSQVTPGLARRITQAADAELERQRRYTLTGTFNVTDWELMALLFGFPRRDRRHAWRIARRKALNR